MKYWIVKIAALLSLAGALIVPTAAPAFAASNPGNPNGTGQPSQSCQDVFPSGPLTPQGFNTSGFNHATSVYAGAQTQNSGNSHSVAQYDVACFQVSQH